MVIKKTITGFISELFHNHEEDRKLKVEDLKKLISNLYHSIEELKIEEDINKDSFEYFIKNIPHLKEGESIEVNTDFKWTENIKKAQVKFNNSNLLQRKFISLKDQHKELCRKHSVLSKKITELKTHRDKLQNKNIEFRKPYQHDEYQAEEASRIHVTMLKTVEQANYMSDKINQIYLAKNKIKLQQSSDFNKGKLIISMVFENYNKISSERRVRINSLYDKISNIKNDIEKFKRINRNVEDEFYELILQIQNNNFNNDRYAEFVKSLGLNPEINPLDLINQKFSLFDFIINFRDSLYELLSKNQELIIYGQSFIELLKTLNYQISLKGLVDFDSFLSRCNDAINEFENNFLGLKTKFNGLPLYGIKQLFSIFNKIIKNPFAYAANIIKDSSNISFIIYSVDLSENFNRAFYDLKPPILASATLSPISDVTDILGLDNSIRAKISPVFPIENYISYSFTGIHSSGLSNELSVFSFDEKNILIDTIGPILRTVIKHTGLFCASHAVLEQTMRILNLDYFHKYGMKLLIARSDNSPVNDDFNYLLNLIDKSSIKGMNNLDARLKIFKELAGKVPIVICGVTGGGLGEGVDFPGNLMELAIILGIPYEGESENNWLNDVRTSFFKMRSGDEEVGKDLAYRQNAIRKVAQTVGRIHRRMDDKGAIIFYDERLLGLKNTTDLGSTSYEYLNDYNSSRHWLIIQDNILKTLSIVHPPSLDNKKSKEINNHIQKVFDNLQVSPNIIDYSEMLSQLKEFYS